jgi:hypothetical protein
VSLESALWYTPADVSIASAAYEMKQDATTAQTLLIVNHIRGIVGAKGITIDELKAPKTVQEPVDLDEMARRFGIKPAKDE